jgi:hypothetical protein
MKLTTLIRRSSLVTVLLLTGSIEVWAAADGNETNTREDFSRYKDVFIPLGATLTGGLFGLLGGLMVATRAEWFRQRSRSEQYALQVREKRLELYSEVSQCVFLLQKRWTDAVVCSTGNTDPTRSEESQQRLQEACDNLDRVTAKALFLGAGNVACELSTISLRVGVSKARNFENSLQDKRDDLLVGAFSLFASMRDELQVEELGSISEEIFKKSLKPEENK